MTAPNRLSSADSALPPIVWLYLICVIIPFSFKIGPLLLSPLRMLLLVMTVPLMVNLFSGKYGKILPLDWLFILHMSWASVAVAVNNPGRAVENVGSTAIEFLGGYLIARAYIRSWGTFTALTRALFLLMVLSLPFAIYEIFTDEAIIIKTLKDLGMRTVAEVDNPPRMGMFRAQVVFAHPIHYGIFCSSVLALSVIGMRGFLSTAGRNFRGMLAFACVVFSVSSGALLAAILQYFLIFWNYFFRNNVRRWTLLVGVLAFMYVTIDLLSNRTPIKVFMTYATFSAHNAYYRSIIFEWGMFNVWRNPIFGLGLRNWIRPAFMHSGTMDNFWLVMAVRYGIPGFLLIAAGYIDALFRVGRRKLAPGTVVSNIRLAWMITFIGLSFSLVTVHVWTSIYSFIFFLLGAGIWIATAPLEDSGDAEPVPVRQRTLWAQSTVAPAVRGGVANIRKGRGATAEDDVAAAKTVARKRGEATAEEAAEPDREPSLARYTRFHEKTDRKDGNAGYSRKPADD